MPPSTGAQLGVSPPLTFYFTCQLTVELEPVLKSVIHL